MADRHAERRQCPDCGAWGIQCGLLGGACSGCGRTARDRAKGKGMAESSSEKTMATQAARRAKVLAKWAGRDVALIEGHDSIRQVGDPEADKSSCRRCGGVYSRGDSFCRHCGIYLDAQFCPHCGQVKMK